MPNLKIELKIVNINPSRPEIVGVRFSTLLIPNLATSTLIEALLSFNQRPPS